MKKITTIMLAIICTYALSSCADSKTIDGVTYRPYGFFNDRHQNPGIHYEIAGDAAVSGILFSECLLIPTVYTYGYNLWEPVCTMEEYNNRTNAGKVD